MLLLSFFLSIVEWYCCIDFLSITYIFILTSFLFLRHLSVCFSAPSDFDYLDNNKVWKPNLAHQFIKLNKMDKIVCRSATRLNLFSPALSNYLYEMLPNLPDDPSLLPILHSVLGSTSNRIASCCSRTCVCYTDGSTSCSHIMFHYYSYFLVIMY